MDTGIAIALIASGSTLAGALVQGLIAGQWERLSQKSARRDEQLQRVIKSHALLLKIEEELITRLAAVEGQKKSARSIKEEVRTAIAGEDWSAIIEQPSQLKRLYSQISGTTLTE